MKKIVTTLAALAVLTLAACGNSSDSGKQAMTPRKVDPSSAVEKSAPAGLQGKEGQDLPSTKK